MEKLSKPALAKKAPIKIKAGAENIPEVVSLVDAIRKNARKKWFPWATRIEPNLDACTIQASKFGGLELTNMIPKTGNPISLDSVTYENDSAVEQKVVFSRTKEVINSISASVTLGFKYKSTYSAKVSIAKLLDMATTQEFEFSLSTTATVSKEVKETFSWDVPITVPAYTEIEATAFLSQNYREPDFSQKIEIEVTDGTYSNSWKGFVVPVWVEGEEGGNWYRAPLGEWLQDAEGVTTTENPNKIIFTCKGKLLGIFGNHLEIKLYERSLKTTNPTKRTHHILEENGMYSTKVNLAPEKGNKPS